MSSLRLQDYETRFARVLALSDIHRELKARVERGDGTFIFCDTLAFIQDELLTSLVELSMEEQRLARKILNEGIAHRR